jgi:hypothetical protein
MHIGILPNSTALATRILKADIQICKKKIFGGGRCPRQSGKTSALGHRAHLKLIKLSFQ